MKPPAPTSPQQSGVPLSPSGRGAWQGERGQWGERSSGHKKQADNHRHHGGGSEDPPPSWVELGHLVPQQWSRRICSFPLGTKELSWRLHQVETSNQAWVLSLPSAGSQLYEGCVSRPERLGPASSAWLLCALSQCLEQRGKHLQCRSCPAKEGKICIYIFYSVAFFMCSLFFNCVSLFCGIFNVILHGIYQLSHSRSKLWKVLILVITLSQFFEV